MQNKSNLVFIHRLIKSFGDSLVKVFIPLIILKSTDSMIYTTYYLIAYYVLCGLFNFLLKKFLQKYGIIAIVLHIFPLIALQFLLTLKLTIPIIFVIAFCAMLAQVLYSVPINLLFAFSDKDANIAKLDIPYNIGRFVFTILSGYVIGSGYKNSLLLLAIVATAIYILSDIPILFGYRFIKEKYNKISTSKYEVDKKYYIKFGILNALFGMFQTILDVCIPLYLYINNISFTKIAIITAVMEILKLGSNLLAKTFVTKNKPVLSISLGAIFIIVSMIFVLTIKIPVILYVCSCVISISFPLVHVALTGTYFRKIKKDNYQFDGMLNRDIYILLPRALFYLPCLICPTLLIQFILGFCVATAIPFFSNYLIKKDK